MAEHGVVFPRAYPQMPICRFLGVLVSVWTLLVASDGSPFAIWLVGAAIQNATPPRVGTPRSASYAMEADGATMHKGSNANVTDGNQGNYTLHPLSYPGCSGVPLVVGGEIVRCEGRSIPRYPFGGLRWSAGPLMNQSFPVEILTGSFSTAGQQQLKTATHTAPAAEKPSASAAAGTSEGVAATGTRNQEKARPLEEPHFIRIFGRWASYSPGLNLWLERDVTPAPLRRLAGKAPAAKKLDQQPFEEVSPQLKQGLSAADAGGADSDVSKHRSPFMYWRQAASPSPVQNSCIALIKLPATERGSSPFPTKFSTAGIPESCEEAWRLLPRGPSDGSTEPFWLSCGPELELSRLTHFLTFSISQEKLNQVLAALEYSVEIWREPHEAKSSRGPKRLSQEAAKEDQMNPQEQAAGEAARHEGVSVTADAQPDTAPARDVEARRLAAQQGGPSG